MYSIETGEQRDSQMVLDHLPILPKEGGAGISVRREVRVVSSA